MDYSPTHVMWEITHECNMECLHCSSSCTQKEPDELSTDEALGFCGDLAQCGIKSATLSGGEPFMREDLLLIAEKLVQNGIKTTIISNGWLISDDIVRKAQKAGVTDIIVSLDGLKKTHDFLRMKGSYNHVLSAMKILTDCHMSFSILTTVTSPAIKELSKIKKILYKNKVRSWLFQLSLPSGNLLNHEKLILSPDDPARVLDFCHNTMKEGKITVDIANTIGYFSLKDTEIRNQSPRTASPFFIRKGCEAGKKVFGILPNGNINACLTIKDKRFIVGNIRETSLSVILKKKDVFRITGTIKKEELRGFCGICQYGNYCFGGCTGAKLALTGSIYENTYCVFSRSIAKEKEKAKKINDVKALISTGRVLIGQKTYQLAEVYLWRAHILEPKNIEVIDLLGFVHFFLENYHLCKEFNEKALMINPSHAYAFKGLGLCLTRMGDVEKGIKLLYHAIELADPSFTDPYYDLSIVLSENNRLAEALHVLGVGRNLSPQFKDMTENFYNSLTIKFNNL
ncbi:MAG: radical SAM protein [Spirochaetales bacterium]|nr:radical SAM protein [Spirochaetales bacterium]